MNPHYEDRLVTLHHGDCLDVLRQLPDNSVDSVVTDPPYGLGFMGKAWDAFGGAAGMREQTRVAQRERYAEQAPGAPRYAATARPAAPAAGEMAAFQAWCELWAAECLRVLKPGGHLLAFGGTRTWHRLACAVEDAGFEVRDSIAWLYGSGFPKSLDVSKAIDKAAGATREVVGSRTLTGTAASSSAHIGNLDGGTGVGATKDVDITAPATDAARQWQGWGTALKPAFEPVVVARKPLTGTVAANVLAHGTGALNIDACRVGTDGGTRRDGKANRPNDAGWENMRGHGIAELNAGRWPANVTLDENAADSFEEARFFYVAKAPTKERPKADDGTAHPTVKPLTLMRWLVRLVTPPGGTVLEPFAGSGTTVEACLLEGFRVIAIERQPEYLPLIEQRIRRVTETPPAPPPTPTLFDLDGEAA